MFDTVVIGKGPAGISAAIYLKRAGLEVLVIGKDMGSLQKAGLIENYYGFAQPIRAEELFRSGLKQAENFGVPIIDDEVTGFDFGEAFTVKTLSQSYQAKTLLIACGKKRKSVSIEGVQRLEGRGVSYCSVCDGFFYKGKKVGVIGDGKFALSEAKYLKNFVKEVTIFTDTEQPLFPLEEGIPVVKDKILEVYGSERVEGIRTTVADFSLDGVFIALGSAGADDFALKLGILTDKGSIAVDENYMTNVEGVFAAGDCIGGFAQVAKAISDGAHAATAITRYLRKKK